MAVNIYTPPPSAAGSSKPARKYLVFGMILTTWGLGGAIGVLVVGLQKGGFLTLSDVGQLTELASVQQKLRPLDACAMEYALRDKHGKRTRFEYVHIRPCGDDTARVLVKVNETWGRSGVGFELERSAADEPWKILVEKEEVPFAHLRGALNEFAPVIAADYARQKGQQDALLNQAAQAREQQEADERARAQEAKSSYPE